MGLLSNLRVLASSSIGEDVRQLRSAVELLLTELEDMRSLQEARYRRLSKRMRDDPLEGATNASQPQESRAVALLRSRRAARVNGSVPSGG